PTPPGGALPGAGPAPGRLPVRVLAGLGLVGCLLLAVNLPLGSVVAGFGVLAAGVVGYLALGARRRPE
ncbi:hypothetical protein ABZU42_01740, partial [Micromonospora profundi]